MRKTCRTCEEHYTIHVCEELEHGWLAGRRYWEQGIDEPTECPRWIKCETSLLVDALAEALRKLRQMTRLPEYTMPPWGYGEAAKTADAALRRYQKEVGDDSKNSN